MKNLIALLLGFYVFIGINAQEIYFNKTYKPDTTNIGSPAVLPVQDGYLSAGPFGSYNTLKHGFYIRKTDLYGETQWFKAFEYGAHRIYAIGGGILTKTLDGHYMLVGSRTYDVEDLNQDLVMIKFMEDGTHLWTSIIEKNDTIESPYHITPTQDGGYILCGIQRTFDTNNRFYVLKTDSVGNKEWDRAYQETVKGAAFTIYPLANNNGYVASGYVHKEGSTTDADMYVVGIALDGSIKWEKTYHPSPESDVAAIITQLDEGNFILTGGYQESNIYHLYLAQIDTLGEIVWNKDYLLENTLGFQARNVIDEQGNITNIISYKTVNNRYAPRVISFNPQGEIRFIQTIPDAPQWDNTYLKDIELTPDGGFVCAGFNYSAQSSWLVKIDSLGNTCSYLGCDSVGVTGVGANVVVEEQETFNLYPNPANKQVLVNFKAPIINGYFSIYNSAGKKILEQRVEQQAQININTQRFKSGVYICQLVSEKEIVSSKLIISH